MPPPLPLSGQRGDKDSGVWSATIATKDEEVIWPSATSVGCGPKLATTGFLCSRTELRAGSSAFGELPKGSRG